MCAIHFVLIQMKVNLLCESQSHNTTRAAVTITSDAFEVDATSSGPVTAGSSADVFEGGKLAGRLTGKSQSLKRPAAQAHGQSSGKINLQGAEAQSMQSLSQRRDGAMELGESDAKSSACSLRLVAHGNIRLETMSWIEAIRRKYGFVDEKQGTLPPASIGRTASASIKAAALRPAFSEEE